MSRQPEKHPTDLLTDAVNPDEFLPRLVNELNPVGPQTIIKEVQRQIVPF
jgi:hypothetical protein